MSEPHMVTDSELVDRLREIVRRCDLRTTTASAVRRRLEEELAVDLYGRRAFITQQIDIFLRNGDQEEEEVSGNGGNDVVVEGVGREEGETQNAGNEDEIGVGQRSYNNRESTPIQFSDVSPPPPLSDDAAAVVRRLRSSSPPSLAFTGMAENEQHFDDPTEGVDPHDPRELVYVRAGKLQPENHKISAFITAQIKLSICDEGHCWKFVTTDQCQWYWDQFVATYKWSHLYDARVHAAWQSTIATLYRKTVHAWRDADKKPKCLAVDVWASWKQIWAGEAWERRSEIYKGNRHSEPAGVGTGMTKHTAGSCSFVDHNNSMRVELGREPNSYELFYKTHTNKAGEFLDERSKSVNAAFQARRDVLAASSGASSSQTNISNQEINQLYPSVVGGVQKAGTMYGLGTQASGIYPEVTSQCGTPTSSRRAVADMQATWEAVEKKAKRVEEKIQRIEDDHAKLRDRMGSLEEQVRALVAGMRTGKERYVSGSAARHQLQTRHSSSRHPAIYDKFTHISGTFGDDDDDADDFLYFDKNAGGDDDDDDDETQAR